MTPEIRKKVVMTGSYIEIREYYYYPHARGVKKERETPMVKWEINEENPEEAYKIPPSIYRSKGTLRKLIDSNVWQYRNPRGKRIPAFFLTLTFGENITDLKTANREFSKFVQRFNYQVFKSQKVELRYIAVPEFQQRGAVHYHVVLFNMPFIKDRVYTKIRNMWGHGDQIELRMVKSPRAIHYYLSKYMVKNFEDGRLFGRKRYFASRNLFRPFIFMNSSADNDIAIELLKDSLSLFSIGQISFDTDFCGKMYIDRYRISENRTLFELETLDPFVKERINSNQ